MVVRSRVFVLAGLYPPWGRQIRRAVWSQWTFGNPAAQVIRPVELADGDGEPFATRFAVEFPKPRTTPELDAFAAAMSGAASLFVFEPPAVLLYSAEYPLAVFWMPVVLL